MPVRYYLSPLTNPLPPGERERRAQERRDYYAEQRADDAARKAPRMGEGTCAQCGTRFPKRFGGRGRPQEYCSEECRELSAALTILKKWAGPVAKRSTAEAWSSVRTDLWSLANAAPAFQKDMAARSKARRAEISAAEAAGIIPKRGKLKVTFELVIGGTPVSDTVYATEASAKTAAKVFSREYPTVVVDVRTVAGKERKARFRAGKSVELLDAYKESGDTDLRLNRGRGRGRGR